MLKTLCFRSTLPTCHAAAQLMPATSRLGSISRPGLGRFTYATFRDAPAAVSTLRQTVSARPPGSFGNTGRFSNRPSLLRPALFAILFSGSAFGLAYYADTHGHVIRDRDIKTKVLSGIIAVNCLVFALHHVPIYWSVARPIGRLLERYGVATLQGCSRRSLALLTSGFSHSELLHLGFNMVAFYSIAGSLFDAMGTNQFLAMYTSTIVLSSFAQLCLTAYQARRGRLPIGALGASGGVYGLLGLLAWYQPDAQLALIFLPFIHFSLGYAFAGMMCLDAAGIVLAWQRFGHAAHFAGGAIGYGLAATGVPVWWQKQQRKAMARRMSPWGR